MKKFLFLALFSLTLTLSFANTVSADNDVGDNVELNMTQMDFQATLTVADVLVTDVNYNYTEAKTFVSYSYNQSNVANIQNDLQPVDLKLPDIINYDNSDISYLKTFKTAKAFKNHKITTSGGLSEPTT